MTSFRNDILPILSDRCFQCHGPDEKARKAKLRLDTREGAFRVKDGVAIIAPGKSEESALFRRIASSDPDEIMPPPSVKRPLSVSQIEMLKHWIEEGATWGEHWAFAKLSSPQPPPVGAFANRVANPIDNFVFARLLKEDLAPSPEAPRETLVRRLSLDLTGLPPTLEEVADFSNDPSPLAYEKLLDRLLGSAAFGERMAWEWLDAARYADSNGYQGDSDRTMWPWRDWVIEAFNRNLPYDQFTVWQLAGDLLPDASRDQRLATGFSRNHMINGEGGRIPEENRVDYVLDMTETMGTVWLGLTLNCCRCHDHKFDPLTRRDYYGLSGFFNQTPVTGEGGDPQGKPNLDFPTPAQAAAMEKARAEIRGEAVALDELEQAVFPRPAGKSSAQSGRAAGFPDNVKKILQAAASSRSRDQLAELEKHFEKIDPDFSIRLKPLRETTGQRDQISRSIVRVMTMEDLPAPRKTFLLERGLYNKTGDEVVAAVPASLPPLPAGVSTNRLSLARWLVSPENPLTARVTVNRIWQQFFGTGLVKTPEDFGVQGEFPKHPELLDWLASEFVRSGWDLKYLCRQIVASSTYRQSSKITPKLLEIDPENRLLARAPRFRMPAWMIRDQALAASGLLVRQVGGAPVKPYQPPGVWEEATFGQRRYEQDQQGKLYRRSLYTFWRRIVGPALFFDSGGRQVCSVKQPRTNSPLHALATLNDITYVEAARALAGRVLAGLSRSEDERIVLTFRHVLSRSPTRGEREVFRESLNRLREEFAHDPGALKKFLGVGESRRNPDLDELEHAAYSGVCLAILNLDEALTKE